MTSRYFVSVVDKGATADGGASGGLTCRFRVREDAERFVNDAICAARRVDADVADALNDADNAGDLITVGGGTDYEYRVTLPRRVVQATLFDAASTERCAYSNFKAEVVASQGATRAHVYSRVWAALRALAGLREPDHGM